MRFSAALVAAALIIAQTSGDSAEAEDSFTGGAYGYGGSNHMNFNEIFSNSLTKLADDSLTSVTKDDFHLVSMPSQFSEFRLQSYTTPPMETTTPKPTPPPTTPPPRFLKAAYLLPRFDRRYFRLIKNITTTTIKTTTTTPITNSTTTTEPTTTGVSVVPLQIPQRGVLDLILPAPRVRNFKDVFETFKRMLSYTFRK